MNPETKQKWLEALRSGKYAQQRNGCLHSKTRSGKDGFCCLGVLLDVQTEIEGKWNLHTTDDIFPLKVYVEVEEEHRSTYVLHPATRDKLGITAAQMAELAQMNDNRPLSSFSDIADWIEVNIPSE